MAQYVVKKGDTLSAIAQRTLGNSNRWRELGFTGDPRKLPVGFVLNIPGQTQPNAPAAAASVPTYTPPSAEDQARKYQDIYKSLEPTFKTDVNVDTGAIEQGAQQKAEAVRGLAPVVQNIYANLAEQLKMSAEEEQEEVQDTKTRELSKQAESAAISGFETTGGFEAAIARSITKDQDRIMSRVTQKWNLKKEQLAQEEIKDVKQLEIEAADAILQGRKDVAELNIRIATIKQQGQQLLQSATNAVMNSTNEQEKQYWARYYQDKQNALEERKFELEAKKVSQAGSGTDMTGLISLLGLGRGTSGNENAPVPTSDGKKPDFKNFWKTSSQPLNSFGQTPVTTPGGVVIPNVPINPKAKVPGQPDFSNVDLSSVNLNNLLNLRNNQQPTGLYVAGQQRK